MKFIKNHIKIIIFLVVCILTFLIYQKYQDKRVTYTSIGDGFASGINSFNDQSYGYSDYLKDYLEEKDILKNYYPNFSYSDMTIKDLYKDILLNAHDQENNNIRQVLRESNLLTISVGINDLIYQMDVNKNISKYQQKKIIEEIVENFDRAIEEIRKYYQNNIIIIGYYNFYPQNSVERNLLDNLNSGLKEYSEKNHLVFVDNSNLNTSLDEYLDNPNIFYPNYRGYEKIFNNICRDSNIGC